MLGAVCDVYLLQGYGAKSALVRDEGHVHSPCAIPSVSARYLIRIASQRTKPTLPYWTRPEPQPHDLSVRLNTTRCGNERHNNADREQDVQAR